jgi:hypothetical protein
MNVGAVDRRAHARHVCPDNSRVEGSVTKAYLIRSAKLMLRVFTTNANNSDEIKKELVLASQSRLIVIPLRVADVTPDDALAYELATRQWIDFFHDREAAMERLVRRIGCPGNSERPEYTGSTGKGRQCA